MTRGKNGLGLRAFARDGWAGASARALMDWTTNGLTYATSTRARAGDANKKKPSTSETTTTTTTTRASARGSKGNSKSGLITRAGAYKKERASDEPTFRVRKSVDATTDVDWEGQKFTGSRLEYAGVEVRGTLRWPIPLHALVHVNPELKELLEVTKSSEEERMTKLLSVLNKSDGGEIADSRVVSTSAPSVTPEADEVKDEKFAQGLAQFGDFLHKSKWRSNDERVVIAQRVRDSLSMEAKKTTASKVNVTRLPLSKTMLAKVKVAQLTEAANALELAPMMVGVSKKAHLMAYLLAFYEYMFGVVDSSINKRFRLSETSTISQRIMRDAERTSNATAALKADAIDAHNAADDAVERAIHFESDPARMNYVKAFEPEELVKLLVRARGIDVMTVNVRDRCTWTDHLVIATARSFHHLKALAGSVLYAVKRRTEYVAGGKIKPIIEGAQNGGDKDWMAVDCGSCMVHIFSPEGRERYNLEELWADGTEAVHNSPEELSINTIRVNDAEFGERNAA